MNQSASRREYEILIVDNGSTDNTEETIHEYANGSFIRYVNEPIIGLSRARNCGWQKARGKYVGYIDDDAVTSKNWVTSALDAFHMCEPEPEWVGGPIYLEWELPRPNWVSEEMCIPLGKIYWGDQPCKISNAQRLGGGNSLFLRKTLEELNGFEESLGRKGLSLLSGEEAQLQKRITKQNGILFYHPGVAIWHNVPVERLTPEWFYRRYYWGGITDYIMNRTLEYVRGDSNSSSNLTAEKENRVDRWKRFSKNTLWSIGICPSLSEKIWGRIYLSYCFGYLMGAAKYWQRHRQ